MLGMKDVVVVVTDDAVLVCPKARAQDVKRVVEEAQEPKARIPMNGTSDTIRRNEAGLLGSWSPA